MISVSKLLCGLDAESDGLRYDAADESEKPQITDDKQRRPVVVWNATKRCNLRCEHCYAAADQEGAPNELSTAEGKALIDDLAEYGVPVLLFSGGEPMVREDLPELVAYAADSGLRPVLSTNGTLLTRESARKLKRAGLKYAGVSVDGLPERNDRIRGREGAFDAAVRGIEACLDVGLKTGLRYTITEHNVDDLAGVSTSSWMSASTASVFTTSTTAGAARTSPTSTCPRKRPARRSRTCVISPASTTLPARRSRRSSSGTTPTPGTSSSTPTGRWGRTAPG